MAMFKSSNSGKDTFSRRTFMVTPLVVMALAVAGGAAKSVARRPKILFVCHAGTAKSAIAREMFRQRARERGITVDVYSRGIELADHVSPELRRKLVIDGIDPKAETPIVLALSDWKAADILVRFNPLPAEVEHRDIRDWSDVPSVNDDYVNARRILNQRIDTLLTEIARP